jgi:hypothetical protein
MATLNRQTRRRVRATATVDGRDLGIFDTWGGGETTAPNDKYRGGNMGKAEPLGGPPEVGDITIGRNFIKGRDNGLVKWLNARAGQAEATIKKHLLDANRNPFDTETYTGILTGVTPSDHDSTSNDPAMIELVFTVDEVIG